VGRAVLVVQNPLPVLPRTNQSHFVRTR
jgi:hypothetical protein